MSVVLGGVVLGYVSAGVVRARPVRVVVAWIVLVLSFIAEAVDVVSADDLGDAALAALLLTTSAVAIVGLARFRRTDWYAWQRTRPPIHTGASIGPLVAIAVLVGALAGVIGPTEDGIDVGIQVAER